MPAQKGLAILLKRTAGGSPQTFTAIGGLRAKTLTFNKETVDVTSADDVARFRQLLAGAGVMSLSVSGSGVLKDDTAFKTMVTASVGDVFEDWQVVIPGIGTYECAFQVAVSFAGEHNGEATYDITLESADDVAFTAA